ncbi:MAG TPA: glycosyl hydrolase family 18 protein [Gemmatimonadaceae bacterium]|nr:glycosyl hydrolase family 18 protein [Gemmatimonadaceae bacterium]
MTTRTALSRALLLLLSASATRSVALGQQQRQAQPSLERLFYHTDTEDSYESFVRHADRISVVAPGAYRVDSLGIVWGEVDRRVLELAKARGVKVMPLLVNEGFHQPSLRKLLADTAARARATRSMAELCRSQGYWGWQFDIENVSIQDRDRLTAWYTEAADALHRAGCTISIAVVHRPGEEAGALPYHRFLFDSWRAGYDLAALGRVGDFVTIMSYSQHTRRTPPGPQAGLPWMRDVADYFLRYVPPEKLSLGIATQSMHWFTREDNTLPERARSWAEAISHRWATGLAERYGAKLQWDDRQGVTYGFYENGGTFEWLFVEDARSFQLRLALAREKRLRGISVWVLGPEDERIWEALK